MRYGFAIGVFAVMLGGAGATRAETLPVEGTYAANVDAPSRVRSIALADFAGRGGERLAFAIDSALRAAIIEGRPYYDLTFTAPAFGESYTFDDVPPTITARLVPSPNALGWNNTPVTVIFECADNTVVNACPAPLLVDQQGANQVVSGLVTDAVGLTASTSNRSLGAITTVSPDRIITYSRPPAWTIDPQVPPPRSFCSSFQVSSPVRRSYRWGRPSSSTM